MSYLVLARKYRPRNFAEMVGQEHVVQALANALTQQRLHHAYLFTGTRGVGKTTVSRILAKSLNCVGPDGTGGITATPCGVCASCTAIDAGRFADYVELDAASNRGVDEVQTLLEQAVYKPVQGRFKVFMIDEVHMLSTTAFNAMLKTLEEPPEYLKFVLATTDPQKVPVTVLSRCLQFNLRPMAPDTVMEHLERVLAAESIAYEAGALALIARGARGSMRDALSLADQSIAYGGGRVEEAAVRGMLGAVDGSRVIALTEALAQGDGRAVVEGVEQLRQQGLSAASTLDEMIDLLQRMAVRQIAPASRLPPDRSAPDAEAVARLAGLLAPDETQLLYSLCLHGKAELGLAPDEYAALTMVLLRLLAFKQPLAAGAEKKTPENPPPPRLPQPLQPQPAPPEPPAPAPPAAEGSVPITTVLAPVAKVSAPNAVLETAERPRAATEIIAIPVREASEAEPARAAPEAALAGTPSASVPASVAPDDEAAPADLWERLVRGLIAAEAIAALVRELAVQSELIAQDGEHWLLRVERETLTQPGLRQRLEAALVQAGHPVRLGVEIGPVRHSVARRDAAVAERRLAAAQATIESDPFVQQMVRDFGAKIVPGSIKALD
ncbi:MAG TPA: DNA polymerase III subunit gamma/tau [Burkholderiaceae bacterium]|nr:DNA polymerase III subunit gamma/tau [Burkholderiaceae bacterium]